AAEVLTDEARLYAMRGASRHFDAYVHEAQVVRTRDRALQRVRVLGAPAAELAAVAEAERNLGELDRLEQAAVGLVQGGDRAAAQTLLYGPEHERAQAAVLEHLESFRALATARTETAKHQAQLDADRASLIAKVILALTGLVFLSVLYFVLRRRVSVPLTRMTGIVTRLARQDYAVEVPNHRRHDEIGDMTTAIQTFRLNGLERERLEAERRADEHTKDCILQMTHRLQACETLEELTEVVTCFAPQTFPDLAGRLYILDDSRNALALAGSWLDARCSAELFPPTDCWGLRRGRPHISNGENHDISCPHIADPQVRSMCVPLTAQGDTIGLLYFEERPDVAQPQDAQRIFLELMSENIALALANLRLRERLKTLVVRDGLTGLYNRRSLDETLNRYATTTGDQLACLMVDIDHFKQFNDNFGHDAGDAVMQHVAQIMLEVLGDAGHAYRFGGEEFTILLPGLDETAALDRAEALRRQIAEAPLAHHGRMLGRITVSVGLAVAPDDGPPATLLKRADAALLQAKSLGRNRTVVLARMATSSNRRPAA
ncbi:MAG: putative diguanylate cyclase with and domain, partial [Caulobacteraceae bacterium]|nr:putative diguanylate cyclase with and domain [Caulobacteraceae bacterium]